MAVVQRHWKVRRGVVDFVADLKGVVDIVAARIEDEEDELDEVLADVLAVGDVLPWGGVGDGLPDGGQDLGDGLPGGGVGGYGVVSEGLDAQLQGIAKKIWFNIIYIQLNDN